MISGLIFLLLYVRDLLNIRFRGHQANFLIVFHKEPLNCKAGGGPANQPEEVSGNLFF